MPEQDDSDQQDTRGSQPPAPQHPQEEKAPHWADRTVAVFTVLIFLTYVTSNYFACQTLREIQSSSADTHELAVAAKSQADAAKAMSEAAKSQTGGVAAQAESMKTLAERALAQAKATNSLAAEAKRSADTATKALSIQSRPWMAIAGEPTVTAILPVNQDTREIRVQFALKNVGPEPAMFVAHNASAGDLPNPSEDSRLRRRRRCHMRLGIWDDSAHDSLSSAYPDTPKNGN